mmetsp:Transcript_39623/g.77025  ORF Transcript_39623/g.77025 Transcript_39623/m.77025 type:complete len:84 (-) Transcript_39623:160-411(-)
MSIVITVRMSRSNDDMHFEFHEGRGQFPPPGFEAPSITAGDGKASICTSQHGQHSIAACFVTSYAWQQQLLHAIIRGPVDCCG